MFFNKFSCLVFSILFLFSVSFACVDLSTPATYGSNVSVSDSSFYINSDTVLCTQSYSHLTWQNLFIINSSNIRFNCNFSNFTGNDQPRAIYAPPGTENLSIFGNCVFNDFTNIFFSDGNDGAYNNNISVTNISGSSSSSHGINLEYTQNSSFSNLSANYSNGYGFISAFSSFNNFTNITSLESLYEGFYLTSESDSNNITDSNFTNNGRNNNEHGLLFTGSSNNNLVYNNYFNNTNNLFSDPINYFNSTYDCSSPNIIGGTCKGGNYYDDITPLDHGLAAYPHNISGDGISDDIGYYIRNPNPWDNPSSIDYLPLASVTSGCTQFRSNSVNIFVASNITLCTVNESFSNSENYAPFYFSSTVRSFNCNNSQLTGNDNSRALYLQPTTSNLSIFGSCIFNDFTYIVFSDGNDGAYNNNISVTNISGSSSSSHGINLEYTQNSSFSNLSANYSNGYGFISAFSSFNNFTNITSLESLYEGFYLTSESDSNNITDSNFTNNGRNNNEHGLLFTGSSNNNLVYNNYFNNTNNLFSDPINYFNSTYDCSSPNIIGGTCKGGNYYDDYVGNDTDLDGIGDDLNYSITNIPSYDYLPLTLPLTSVNISKSLLNNTNTSAGGIFQYLINVSNNGSTYLTILNITDSFSQNLSYSSSSYAPSSNTSSSVTWLISTNLAPSSSYLLYVNLSALSNLSNASFSTLNVTNNASISALSTTGVYANSSTSLNSTVYSANFSVSKSLTSSSIVVGQTVNYTINISNPGYLDLSFDISDTLPAGLIYNSSNVSPDYSSGSTLIWLVNLSPNSNYSLSYSVSSNASGTLVNSVTVLAAPPNGHNLSKSTNISLTVLSEESSPSSEPVSSSGSSDDEDPIRVSHTSNCTTNEVLVQLGSQVLENEFVAIEQNGLVVFLGRTNEHGRFYYSLSGNPVRVRVGSSSYFGPFDLSSFCNSSESLNLTLDVAQNQTTNDSSNSTESDLVPLISDDSSSDSDISQPLPSLEDDLGSDNFASNSTSSSSGDSNSSSSDLQVQNPQPLLGSGLMLTIVFVAILGGFSVYWFLLRK